MKLDLITFETPGGASRDDLQFKRYDFSKMTKTRTEVAMAQNSYAVAMKKMPE
jgi:hypothetical protein